MTHRRAASSLLPSTEWRKCPGTFEKVHFAGAYSYMQPGSATDSTAFSTCRLLKRNIPTLHLRFCDLHLGFRLTEEPCNSVNPPYFNWHNNRDCGISSDIY